MNAEPQALIVNEMFLSLQGEGPSLGEHAMFLRLARCNLTCSWCDTRYSWDWEAYDERIESVPTTVEDVADRITGTVPQPRLLVITGGEPLLQQRALTMLLQELTRSAPAMRAEFETNGTIAAAADLSAQVHRFVVSPKLANSKLPEQRRIRPSVLRRFADHPRSVLKFVLQDPSELEQVDEIRDLAGFSSGRVWLMPEGATAAEQTQLQAAIADAALSRGYNFTPRLHTLLWGPERSR